MRPPLLDTLAEVRLFTIPIHITDHTFIAVVTLNTDRGILLTTAIGADFAPLTDLVDALGGLATTMLIGRTLCTGHTTDTDGRHTTAPGIAIHITALALLINTLGRQWVITIVIPHTAHATVPTIAGHTDRGRNPPQPLTLNDGASAGRDPRSEAEAGDRSCVLWDQSAPYVAAHLTCGWGRARLRRLAQTPTEL